MVLFLVNESKLSSEVSSLADPTLKPATRGSLLALLKGACYCVISSLHLQSEQLCNGLLGEWKRAQERTT